MSRPLRILHVNTEDTGGGAANAAQRISKALRDIGVDSRMLVLLQHQSHPQVLQGLSKKQRELHRLKLALSVRRLRRQHTPGNAETHSLNWFDSGLADWINRSDFDVVNLHWIGADFLSVEEIGRIRKPLVWTLHDMWAFCGAEHYDDLDHPGRYRTEYGQSTRPAGYSGLDLDAWVWRRKRRAWANRRFHVVGPSHWMAECASASTLFGQQPVQVIANCLDACYFKPIDRRQARHILGLDPGKRYVLFGAVSSTSNTRKGFHLLKPALQHLAQQPAYANDTELLVFGAHAPESAPDFGLPTHYLGRFHDDISLAVLYSAADVFVAPSTQDNLPNTIAEALSCGTPCAAFRVGGIPDMIEHQRNGWLAAPFDVIDLAQGLMHLLTPRSESGHQSLWPARLGNESSVARQYLDLYQRAIAAHGQ